METFTELKDLVDNPHFRDQRQRNLRELKDAVIDEPIKELINGFNKLSYCFTLQSCYGHFIYDGQNDPHNLGPLPLKDSINQVVYRIAYMAFCIENSTWGRLLLNEFLTITEIDPKNIQFGCAEWFWKRQINSYAFQVEPDRFKFEDKAVLDYKEALIIENVRNQFFVQLGGLLQMLPGR